MQFEIFKDFQPNNLTMVDISTSRRKRVWLLGFIIMIVFGLLAGNSAAQNQKLALIVAVGDYPAESGWEKLSSVNDVGIVKSALMYQGFDESNMLILIDNEATKSGILEAFDQITRRVNEGDIFYFHFSGHGQQIFDDNGDEIFDGLDEALVPFDAGMRYGTCEARGANHLRDDLLGRLLDRIRKRIGPAGDVIVVLDACHSGTATRGIGRSRGTDVVFAPSGFVPLSNPSEISSQSFMESSDTDDLAPMVVISGSGASERNFEYNGYGSLSFALSYVLPQMDKHSTYRELFERIRNKMNIIVPRQNPQLEGSADRMLFAGKAVEQKPYILPRDWINSTEAFIDAGRLNGISAGSLVELHPIGTAMPDEIDPLASGIVTEARMILSHIKLDRPITEFELMNTWIFVKEYSFDMMNIPIMISDELPFPILNGLSIKIQNARFLELSDDNPALLIEWNKKNHGRLTILSNDGIAIFEEEFSHNDVDKIVDAVYTTLQIYAQAQMLRSLEVFNPDLNVSFELIPVEIDARGNIMSEIDIESKKTPSGKIVLREGDHFKFRITNNGSKRVYYGMIDIQPDNVINVLIPEKYADGTLRRSPADCFIEKGQTIELPSIYRMTGPYGIETFKLIAAEAPFNLNPIVVSRGSVFENMSQNPIEMLFAESFSLLTRSNRITRIPPDRLHIHTVVFEIAPVK